MEEYTKCVLIDFYACTGVSMCVYVCWHLYIYIYIYNPHLNYIISSMMHYNTHLISFCARTHTLTHIHLLTMTNSRLTPCSKWPSLKVLHHTSDLVTYMISSDLCKFTSVSLHTHIPNIFTPWTHFLCIAQSINP